MNGLSGRLPLVALFLTVVAALSIACGQEAAVLRPAEPPQFSATEGHSDTPQAKTVLQREGESNPTALTGSRSSVAPAPAEAGSFGNFNLSPLPQTTLGETAPVAGGLTVSGVGIVTLPADEAYVVVFPEPRYGFSGPERLSDDDRDDIVAKLVEIGIPETDVEFDYRGRYGQTSISVALLPSEVGEKSEEILEAVEEVVRSFDDHGLSFALTATNCDRALSLARRQAAPAAERTADDLASALGLERGAVIGALESGPVNFLTLQLAGDDHDVCNTQAGDPYGTLLPFDAEPEVKVSVGLQVTYRIQ